MNASKEPTLRTFVRVQVPVTLAVSVDITGLNTDQKKAIRARVEKDIRSLADAEGAVKIPDRTGDPIIYIAKLPETSATGDLIYPLAGLKVVDVFQAEKEPGPWGK